MTKKKKENPLNNLSGKDWLKFQKSWFKYEGKAKLYTDNIRFFTKESYHYQPLIGITPHTDQHIINELKPGYPYRFELIQNASCEVTDYILIDLLKEYHIQPRIALMANELYLEELAELSIRALIPGGYLTVFVRNEYRDSTRKALAFDTAKVFKRFFSIRDERIGCPIVGEDQSPFYCLHFRKKGV